jgi:hypothetical protein
MRKHLAPCHGGSYARLHQYRTKQEQLEFELMLKRREAINSFKPPQRFVNVAKREYQERYA